MPPWLKENCGWAGACENECCCDYSPKAFEPALICWVRRDDFYRCPVFCEVAFMKLLCKGDASCEGAPPNFGCSVC